jgi:diacylglycerol kinase family enzyme
VSLSPGATQEGPGRPAGPSSFWRSSYDRAVTRILLIVNPFASRVHERGLRAVEEALGRAGQVETVLTERAAHAIELAARSADAVVAFGGDGVVNEALNGIPDGVPFGPLPGGGTSVFARALGLPRDPVAAAERVADAIASGRKRRIGLGRVEGRRFCFAAGVGFDAELVRRVDALGRAEDGRRPGDFAFVRQLVRMLGGSPFKEPVLEIAGLGRAAAVLVANGDPYTYAGSIPLHVSRDARFELGLDLAAPVHITRRTLVHLVAHAVRGTGRPSDGLLLAHDIDRIEIACDGPLPLHVDGEDLGDVERVVIEAERDAIDVFA